MKKLYVVRSYVTASSVKEAITLSKKKDPDEVYIPDEWINKVGFVRVEESQTRGFENKKK